MLVRLCEVPEFMRKGEFVRGLYEDAELCLKSKNYDGWFNIMMEEYEFKYFAETDEVSNLHEFWNLIKVCEFLCLDYNVNIFKYFLLNKDACTYLILEEYMYLFGYTFDKLRKLYNEIIKNPNKLNNYIEGINNIEYNILYYFKYEFDYEIAINPDEISNEELLSVFNIFIENDWYVYRLVNLSNDKIQLGKLLIDLNKFEKLYRTRKDKIDFHPVIPINGKIMNEYYMDKYFFDVFYVANRIYINVYVNSVYIYNFYIDDYRYVFTIVDGLKKGKINIESESFNMTYNNDLGHLTINGKVLINFNPINDDNNINLFKDVLEQFENLKSELIIKYNLNPTHID